MVASTSRLFPEGQGMGGAAPDTGPLDSTSTASVPAQTDGAWEARESDGVLSPPDGEICSVCHDDFTLPCQANCGHWFCGTCTPSPA